MQSKVSIRGQTVIPNFIRKAFGITANSLLYWKVQDGLILVYPLPADPVQSSLGVLREKGSFEEFLRDRNEGRSNELKKDIQR